MKGFRDNILIYAVAALVLANALIWYAAITAGSSVLTVTFLDVGQGDSVFIETPNGNQMLIDGGGNKKVLRELSRIMPFYDRSIDIVLATHPDADHIGGLIPILDRYDVKTVLRSGVENDTPVFNELNAVVQEKNIEEIIARRGMQFILDEEIVLKILFPDRDVRSIESNSGSIISQLVFGEIEFLFTGDAPKSIEKYIVTLDGKKLQSDVLKAGHHGSKTSTDEGFLGFVSPEYAVISAGKNNRYGHPHKEVLDLLEHFDIKTLSTATLGQIEFISNGEIVMQK